MNADGTAVRNVTNTSFDERAATWSPDGSRLAYHSARGQDRADLYSVAADGSGGEVNITRSPTVKDVKPAWSPDGSLIAYESAVGDGLNDDIWVSRVDGSNPRRLTTHPHREWYPAWSPDSQWLAFMSLRDGNWEIYAIRRDGTGERRVTESPLSQDYQPAWSPDGTRIAYMRGKPGISAPTLQVFVTYWADADLMEVAFDTRRKHLLLTDPRQLSTPDYRPC